MGREIKRREATLGTYKTPMCKQSTPGLEQAFVQFLSSKIIIYTDRVELSAKMLPLPWAALTAIYKVSHSIC